MKYFRVEPHDPPIARDGRPFNVGGGNRMRPLEFLYPSVLAGSLRTFLGKQRDQGFPPPVVNELRAMEVGGPFPMAGTELYFPAPQDAVMAPGYESVYRLRPAKYRDDEGTDLPVKWLKPALLEGETDDFKAGKATQFWSCRRMTEWLLEEDLQPPPKDPSDKEWNALADGYIASIGHDWRWHVQMDAIRYAAVDQRLFLTAGLSLPAGVSLAGRAELPESWTFSDGLHSIGGERRLAFWELEEGSGWRCPEAVAAGVATSERIRMVLASPGLFQKGWLPGWLNEEGRGEIPGTSIEVQLECVCAGRWRAISGFSLDVNRYGRKPVRRMVPAGAVYFFKRLDDLKEEFPVEDLWLRPVADLIEDVHNGEKDGFGLALWGVWQMEGH